MTQDRSTTSQGWFMYYLGLLNGQESTLLEKAGVVIELHEKVRKRELDPTTVNTHVGLEELVELTKKYQNNAALLMARCEMWRLDWKQEHGDLPEAPKVDARKS